MTEYAFLLAPVQCTLPQCPSTTTMGDASVHTAHIQHYEYGVISEQRGRGFGNSETIMVEFDTTQVGTVLTDLTGKFKLKIQVPGSAIPGNHIIQAKGQTSGLSSQATILVQTNWSMFGFGLNHDRLNPFENVLNITTVPKLVLSWTTPIGYAYSSPTVVNGILYIGSEDHKLYAFNSATGIFLWAYLTGGFIDSTPTVINGVVYVGSDDAKLYALNAQTGALKWTFTSDGAIVGSSPTVANDIVYFGSNNGSLYALYAPSGAVIWTYSTGSNVESSPAVVNGVVYFGAFDNKLYALYAPSGALLWAYTTGGHLESSPSVANGVVYLTSEDHSLYALNDLTGTSLWSYATGDRMLSSPTVVNGLVFACSIDTQLYAFHLSGVTT